MPQKPIVCEAMLIHKTFFIQRLKVFNLIGSLHLDKCWGNLALKRISRSFRNEGEKKVRNRPQFIQFLSEFNLEAAE